MFNQTVLRGTMIAILAVLIAIPTVIAGATERVEKEDFVAEHGGYSVTLTETFKVKSGENLEMENLIGDINVNGGNKHEVKIIHHFFFDVDTQKEAESAFNRHRSETSQSGDVIRVVGKESHRRPYVDVSYDVSIPSEFNIDIETMGGDVQVDKLKGMIRLETLGGDLDLRSCEGEIEGETAGGDINVENFIGETDIRTAGGDVDLRDGKKGPFRLETSGGDITLRSTEGRIDAQTSGGNVEADKVKGDVDLSTSGGDIIMEDVEGVNHRASTSGGDVEANNVTGEVELKTSGGEVTASAIQGDVYGRTSGGDIEVFDISGDADISTSGGSLDVKGVMGRLVGKTSGGDITAVIQGQGMLKESVRLSTSGGELTIKLPGDVKASVQAEIRSHDPFGHYNVRSDFKLKIVDDDGHGYKTITATGDINGGGPRLELYTSDGDINIEKR